MGVMRFTVSSADRIREEAVEQAYLAGLEQIPWLVRTRAENGQLLLERQVSESANLHIPWDMPGYGPLMLTSASLVERARPYSLPLELARGKLSQVRNQLADWQAIGLLVPEWLQAKIKETLQYFSRAVVAQDDPESPALAEQALAGAVEAAYLLATCYTEQAIAVRRRNGTRLPTALGADLGNTWLDDATAAQYLQTFNAAAVPCTWREVQSTEGNFNWAVSDKQIEWCQANGLRVYAGPLIRPDRHALPDWLCLWQDDFESLLGFCLQYVRAVVNRYRGKVNTWICAARTNTAEVLELSEEQNLHLTARVIELVHQLDADTPVVLSFDQPWAEYLSRKEMDFPPLHFADALIRTGLGLTALMLEINVGYQPGGTLLRDALEISRRLDQWAAMFGLPLHVSLCAPSAATDDPLAQHRVQNLAPSWNPRSQQLWVNRHVPLIVAKPYVHGVLWNQLRDSEPHEFPNAGLFDVRRHAKPALKSLAALRQTHLK